MTTRVVLEVLKWSSASDILQHLSQVCRLFARLSDQDEVWYELLGPEYEPSTDLSPKRQYQQEVALFIPIVTEATLKKFYVKSQTWKTVELSERLSVYRFMCTALTADRRVFVTGAPRGHDTYEINPLTGKITFRSQMLTHRNSMGVIRYGEDIYIFGGYSGPYHQECEVFMHRSKQWRELPKLINARSAVTPSYHKEKIYVLGGCGTNTGEYLDTLTDTFHLLSLELPDEHCTVVICSGLVLFGVQQHGFYSCDIENIPRSWEMNTWSYDFGIAFWSDFPVIEVNGTYYIHQNYQSRILALNLSTKQYTEYSTGVPPRDNPS